MMKKNGLIIVLLLVMALLTAACGTKPAAENSGAAGGAEKVSAAADTNEELTFKHKLGETKVKKNPQKVVVFDYGVLDSLDQLGVEVTGLPQQGVPSYLAKYKDAKYANAGGLMEPDFEKINAMEPDLIIISGRQADSYAEFSKIAPTLFMAVDTSKYLESFKENMKTLGQIFGKEKEVDTELANLDTAIQGVQAKASARDKKGLIVLANEGKVSAYGKGSRFGIIHDVLGVKPADEKIEVSTHGQSVSYEYIAEKNPDYLYVIDRGSVVAGKNGQSSPAKQAVENDIVKGTNAFKDGHVVYLDANYWYLSGGGLASVAQMVKDIDASL